VDAAKEWETKTGSTIKVIKTDAGVTDPSLQVRDLEDLAVQKVDGVFVFAGDVATCDEAIGRVYNTENIPVVITDIGIGKSDYVSFIITDNYLGGQMAAEAMAESVPKGSKVVAFQIAPNNLSTRNRADGFMDKAKELGYNVLPEKVVVNTAEGGKLVMEDTMTAEPDIAAVFGTANDCAIGVANALKTADKVGKIKLLCFDINDIILQLVKEGTIEAVVVVTAAAVLQPTPRKAIVATTHTTIIAITIFFILVLFCYLFDNPKKHNIYRVNINLKAKNHLPLLFIVAIH